VSDTKRIAVIGATGAQGGGLVRAILSDPEGGFSVRGLSRTPDSTKSLNLEEAGAEMVEADLDIMESLEDAFRGVHGVFAMTNYWEHFSPERELMQASHIAEAAKLAGVKHLIWSTMEDTRMYSPLDDPGIPTLRDAYKVPAFDGKGEAMAAFDEHRVPATYLMSSFHWENFINFGMGPTKGPDGTLSITAPMGEKQLPGIAVEDIGRCAYGIFKGGSKYIGQGIGVAGERLTFAQMAYAFSRVLDVQVRYNDVTPEEYRAFPFPGADEMGNMFQFMRDFSDDFCAVRDIPIARGLNPQLQTFAQWLDANLENMHLKRA